MRELKFRYVFKHKKTGEIKTKIFNIDEIENFYDDNSGDGWDYYPEYDIISRDWYTGLKDKNDVEIYEGDICIIYKKLPIIKFIVKWENETAGYTLENISDKNDTEFIDDYALKIIGNIHENPELLK